MAADSLADSLDALSVAPLTIDSTDDQLRLIVECVPRQQLASLRRVCKTWRRVLDADEQLWERACREEWSLRWWWAWGFATRPSTWRAWWLEGREVQLPKRALTDAEWWETQPHAALLHCVCFGFQDPELLRTFISANGRRMGWLHIMQQHNFDVDVDDLTNVPGLDDGLHVPVVVLIWFSLALLSMRTAADHAHIFLDDRPPTFDEAFAASVFETPLTSKDVFHRGSKALGVWHTRWMLIVGTFGSTMNMIRSYRAGDDPPNLVRQRPYAAEIRIPPYRPCRLRSPARDGLLGEFDKYSGNGVRDFAWSGAVLMAAPHNGRVGLLLTGSQSYPLPGQGLPNEGAHVQKAHEAWEVIRAECADIGLPAGLELEEVERGSTECLRAAELSISRWKGLRKRGARIFYTDNIQGRVHDATWTFAIGFFNLFCPDDGREQDLHGIFYE